MAVFREGVKTSQGLMISNPVQDTGIFNTLASVPGTIKFVRVTDIILNEQHDKFNEVGQWNGIGTIYYESIGSKEKFSGYAYPLNPNYKILPLANEVVILFNIPSKLKEDGTGFENFDYYFNPLNIWNHPHHNAYPNDLSIGSLDSGLLNDYKKADTSNPDSGYVRRIEDEGTDIELNYKYYSNTSQNTFEEKPNIHPILPFTGDVIIEGRHGQSIRFGSTALSPSLVTQPSMSNPWSNYGNNGDPITIIRNGQSPYLSDKGWEPTIENIKYDLSSIYLTSNQQIISCSIANEEFKSFPTKPIGPSSYINPQIIINSDRIIINSKADSVFISGQKSIGISSNESVNLESLNSINLDSPLIRLGGLEKTQPALLGEDTVKVLTDLINELISLTSALKFIQKPSDPTQAIVDPGISNPAGIIEGNLNNILNRLEPLKSNIVKIK